MATGEKLTYIGYREGLNPRFLTLGSLMFDFANPKTRDPYIHGQLTADDRDLWALDDPVENCWVGYSSGKGCSFGGGVLNFADLNVSRTIDNYNLVVAKAGTKIELLKPAEFFEKVTLHSDEARFWLESRLAVSRKLRYYYGITLQHPKIWLLTGLYIMKDATCLSIYGQSSGFGGSMTLPLPDPSGIAAALQLNPNAKWDTKNGLAIGGGATFPGYRVWAAQYHRVKARYFDVRDEAELSLKQLKLLRVFDMRASRGEFSAAEVELDGTMTGDREEEEEEASEEAHTADYWEKFTKELRDIEAEFE